MDITGFGYTLKIDKTNRALVDARSDFQVAAENGDAFIWVMEQYDYTAVDTILLVRNDHSTKKLHITEVRVQQGAGEVEAEIHVPTAAFAATGTAVVGTNLNRESNKVAEATAIADETVNTQGTIVQRLHTLNGVEVVLDFKGALKLGHDQAIGIDLATGADWCLASITGYFK